MQVFILQFLDQLYPGLPDRMGLNFDQSCV